MTDAAEGSQLQALRTTIADRSARARAENYLDLRVPCYDSGDDPPVWLRLRPLTLDQIADIEKRWPEKDHGDLTNLWVNADMVATSTEGIFQTVPGDDEARYSIDPDDLEGTWPRFGPRIAELLGLPSDLPVVEIVRKLFLTDGDIVIFGMRVNALSGFAMTRAREAIQGK